MLGKKKKNHQMWQKYCQMWEKNKKTTKYDNSDYLPPKKEEYGRITHCDNIKLY